MIFFTPNTDTGRLVVTPRQPASFHHHIKGQKNALTARCNFYTNPVTGAI
jgi:hypothetical protein